MKKVLFYASVMLLLSVSIFAKAAPIDTVAIDAAAKTLTISGSGINNDSGLITLEVLKDGVAWRREVTQDPSVPCVDEYDAENEEDSILNYLSFLDTVALNNDGSYEVVVQGYDEENLPEIRVRFGKKQVFYYSSRAIIDINESATAEALRESVLSNAYVAEQTKAQYDKLNEQEQKFFWDMMLTYKEKIGGFADLQQVIDSFFDQICFAKLQAVENKEGFDSFLSYCKDYGIDESNSYDLYFGSGIFDDGQMCSAQKDMMIAEFLKKKNEYSTIREFVEDFWDLTVLYACHNNDSKYSVREILIASDRLDREELSNFLKKSQAKQLEISLKINLASSRYKSIAELTKAVCNVNVSNEEGGSGTGGGSNKTGKPVGTIAPSSPTSPLPEVTEDKEPLFVDMEDAKWAKEAVTELWKAGIVSGRDEKHFAPMDKLTREEFVKLMVMALGCFDEKAKTTFTDADDTAWYYPYLASAQQSNLILGLNDGSFGVGRAISRQEMAAILARCATGGNIPPRQSLSYTDASSISDWAADAVSYVTEQGIMVGIGEAEFAPLADVSRAQAAKAVFEMRNRR